MPIRGRYRILSLDGGGSWASIEVRALQAVFGDLSGHEILSKFDLVVANSGGSIVAASLAGNWRLSQILELFTDASKRNSIFDVLPWYDRMARVIGLGPKYSTNGKIAGLRAVLNSAPTPVGDLPLAGLPGTIGLPNTDFLIVGFDYDLQRARFFRTNINSQAGTFSPPDQDTTLAMAVHASSNAPVNFFNEPAKFFGGQFWDGAIGGYNNPVLAGVLELLALGVSRESIDVLSVGTANVNLPSRGNAADPALLQAPRKTSFPRIKDDLLVLASSIVDDPPDAASFHAHLALTQRLPVSKEQPMRDGPIVRLNPLIRPVLDGLGRWVPPRLNPPPGGDDLSDFKRLANLDMDATADQDIALILKLADAWIADEVRNQPIRARRNDDPGCEIGHERFSDARSAWLSR